MSYLVEEVVVILLDKLLGFLGRVLSYGSSSLLVRYGFLLGASSSLVLVDLYYK
jgi:hypothetical protein